MNIITESKGELPPATAVALGSFDGLHPGHRSVIEAAVNSSLPGVVFSVERQEHLLTPAAEKNRLLAAMGVHTHLSVGLHEICHLSPSEFFETVLIRRLHARKVCCGYNFRFGYQAAGDAALLSEFCREAGVELTVIDPVLRDGQPVSSTRIRNFLESGEPEKAAALLGRDFTFTLPVVHGRRLGRQLGFATINQPWPKEALRPRFGVYTARLYTNGRWVPGVCNIGVRPTVDGGAPVCETHLLEELPPLYGEECTVALLHFLRPEQTFASTRELQQAIQQDVTAAAAYFDRRP